jgi:hypothetical protein
MFVQTVRGHGTAERKVSPVLVEGWTFAGDRMVGNGV